MSLKYGYHDLKTLMSRLRDPVDGCPWDIKQNYRSIVPHTLEEVYEVIDTIERNDYEHLSEELGDLLFQVVFYAQIADDEERFSLDDVIHQLVCKLIIRHPHVFPDGTLESRVGRRQIKEEQVPDQWDQIKNREKTIAGKNTHLLSDIPHAMPGLLRGKKLQSRAAKVGFDWPHVNDVIDKAYEELAELKEAIESGDQDEIEDELGDILFVLANVARHTKIDPEQAIRRTNQKFESRFRYVEEKVESSGQPWSHFDLKRLDDFWDEAKGLEKK